MDHIAAFKTETKLRLVSTYPYFLSLFFDGRTKCGSCYPGDRVKSLGVFAMNNKINVDGSKGYIIVINTDVEREDFAEQGDMPHWDTRSML